MLTRRRDILGCLILLLIVAGVVAYAFLSANDGGSSAKRPISRKVNVSPASAPKRASSRTLKAEVTCNKALFVITNKDSFAWRNVKFEVNYGLLKSGYSLKAAVIEAGAVYTVGTMQFAKSDGTRLNLYKIKVQKMSIFCDTRHGPGSWFGSWGQ